MPVGHTTRFYDAQVIEDGKIRKEPTYLTEFWTRHAVRFIEQNKDRPFFLYVPYNGPYGLGRWMLQPGRGPHVGDYAGQELLCFPRQPIHEWLRATREFMNNIECMRRYSEQVTGVDDGVGVILATLERWGLDENTLVIYAADQGLCGGHHGMWGMGDHSRPLHTFDCGLHIPMIWRMPNRIPAGATCDLLVSNYDFMPTLLAWLGLGDRRPKSPESPGRDYSPALAGRTIPWEPVVFYEFENCRMIRTDRWKLTRRYPGGPDELYDLGQDPGENNNLIDQPGQAGVRQRLHRQLEAFFRRYADPKYDLWNGGISKAPFVVMNSLKPASSPAKTEKTH